MFACPSTSFTCRPLQQISMDTSSDHPVMCLTLCSVCGKCFLFPHAHTLVESAVLTPEQSQFKHEMWSWTNGSEGKKALRKMKGILVVWGLVAGQPVECSFLMGVVPCLDTCQISPSSSFCFIPAIHTVSFVSSLIPPERADLWKMTSLWTNQIFHVCLK